jgi:hypothetical protein
MILETESRLLIVAQHNVSEEGYKLILKRDPYGFHFFRCVNDSDPTRDPYGESLLVRGANRSKLQLHVHGSTGGISAEAHPDVWANPNAFGSISQEVLDKWKARSVWRTDPTTGVRSLVLEVEGDEPVPPSLPVRPFRPARTPKHLSMIYDPESTDASSAGIASSGQGAPNTEGAGNQGQAEIGHVDSAEIPRRGY